jgi:hypothetical protein
MAKPIPFVGPPGQRDTTDMDQRFVNVLFEIKKNPNPSEYPVQCIKRPGLSTSTQPFGGAATGRGVYCWSATGSIYSVFGASTFVNTSTLVSTMSTTTGRVWFAESNVLSGNQLLYVSDGVDNFVITSSNIVSRVNAATDADYPTPNNGPIVYLDGYLFQGQSNGKLWNSVLNASSSWLAADYVPVDTYGSALEAHLLQKDQIIAFTKNRIEFFFNNGNPTNSPLLRIDQNTLGFGLASKESLAWAGEIACFVSENSGNGDGGRSVYMIASLGKVSEISQPPLNRILAAEGPSISSCSAWMERLNGHLVYWLNLASVDKTFVYDIEAGMWSEAESATSTRFNLVSATSKNGTVFVQHATDGRIYSFQPTVYQDAGTTFEVVLQTARSNFGSPMSKTETELALIGDTTLGSVSVSVSDNDYSSFAARGSIDMSVPDKKTTRLGSFYNRAHKFVYASTSSFRVQAWVPEMKQGIG